jgi:hypothetical protein
VCSSDLAGIRLLGLFVWIPCRLLFLLIMLACGNRSKFSMERRPWDIGPLKNWTKA